MNKILQKSIIKIIIMILIIIIIYLSILNICIKFELIGSKTLEYNSSEVFNDPGTTLKFCILNKCNEMNPYIKIIKKNNKIEYIYTNGLFVKKISQNIKITDTTSPKIILEGDTELHILPKDFIEPGFTVIDDVDGNITHSTKYEFVGNEIHYTTIDSSGNKSVALRKFIYDDDIKPTIQITGDNTIFLKKNDNFIEPGYTANDNIDGNLTNKVTLDSNLDNSKIGEYRIIYSVSDANGNNSEYIRTIYVTNTGTSFLDKINDIKNYIEKNKYSISVGYVDINSKISYKYNSDKLFFGASLIKTVDALYMYEKTELTPYTKNLVRLAISQSNNQAHYTLMNIIGSDNLKNYGISLGALNTLRGGGKNGYTTVEDQIIYLSKLYKYITSNENGEELKKYFLNDYVNLIKFGDHTVMHKYGKYESVFHDVGIFLEENPYIIVILTNESNRNCHTIMQNLSKKIYELHDTIYNENL